MKSTKTEQDVLVSLENPHTLSRRARELTDTYLTASCAVVESAGSI